LHASGAFRAKAAVAVVARALREARRRCWGNSGVTHDRA
jgi:hypothetical protein